MALAAAGSEVVSAASGQVAVASATATTSGHYCVESASVEAGAVQAERSAPVENNSAAILAGFVPANSCPVKIYDADGRCLAGLADANARQLLFVKISRA